VVSIGIEVRIGEAVGMMNIAMPSIVIKMMRQKFDQQWSVRKTHASEVEQRRVLRVLRQASLRLRRAWKAPRSAVRDLLELREGNLLIFDFPVDRPIELTVNGASQVYRPSVSAGRNAPVWWNWCGQPRVSAGSPRTAKIRMVPAPGETRAAHPERRGRGRPVVAKQGEVLQKMSRPSTSASRVFVMPSSLLLPLTVFGERILDAH
jgi:hypothetical protein